MHSGFVVAEEEKKKAREGQIEKVEVNTAASDKVGE
jgi:hypothetical protein